MSIRTFLKRFTAARYLDREIRLLQYVLGKPDCRLLPPAYCHCCSEFTWRYWSDKYEQTLRTLVPKWHLGTDYVDYMIKRENVFCANCKSVSRMPLHAKTILRLFKFRNVNQFVKFLETNPSFIIYEAARYHIFRHEKIKSLKNYIVSEYYPSRTFGGEIKGVLNEDLQKLSFKNETFDLIITSEVLEHVAHLSRALNEIRRVLKPSGYHVFTIPIDYSLPKTQTRAVLLKNGRIKHILPPAIHGDDISSGSLAFRDFGLDTHKLLEHHSFEVQDKNSVFITQKK